DGYKAMVCPSCARKLLRKREKKEMKVAIRETKAEAPLKREPPRKPPKGVPTPKRRKVEEIEYVEGYGAKIREARESLGLTIEQVAAALNIKASLLRNIEAEKVIPPYEVARAIEKLLEISIIQRNPERSASALPETAPPTSIKSITLGEIVEVKKKRRKR
ncbi:MAG: helix-turn-helix domain-containing protein, partial [Candidatus Korarchaeota archaeon]|nr:helix-turn-helix domain-containing protein [Candidatus Korarchaeota archaeon]